jgi:hypothetical protein
MFGPIFLTANFNRIYQKKCTLFERMLSLYGDVWRSRALSKTCPIGLKFSEVIYIHLIFKKKHFAHSLFEKSRIHEQPYCRRGRKNGRF